MWSYDFVSVKTQDGRTLRMLTLIDEYTRECLPIRVARRQRSYEVVEALADVMLCRGIPEHVRSDNRPEFVAKELRKWLASVGTVLTTVCQCRYMRLCKPPPQLHRFSLWRATCRHKGDR